jgi:hypothetical protein
MDDQVTPELLRGMIPIFALAGSTIVVAVWIVAWTIKRSVQARAFEQSRREIAAYIAEGSMNAQDGATLLAVQTKPAKPKDAAKRLAMHVALGNVNKKEAKTLAEARAGVTEATWCEMVDLCIRGLPVEEAVKLARSRSGPAPAGAVPA